MTDPVRVALKLMGKSGCLHCKFHSGYRIDGYRICTKGLSSHRMMERFGGTPCPGFSPKPENPEKEE